MIDKEASGVASTSLFLGASRSSRREIPSGTQLIDARL